MKLPENSYENRIYRDARRNPYRAGSHTGIEPMFLGGVWDRIKKVGKGLLKPAACAACDLIPNAMAKAACKKLAC